MNVGIYNLRHRFIWRSLCTIGLLLPVAPGSAQQRRTSASTELLLSDDHVDQVVVTASRVAMKSGDAPSAVTVFTDKDIREMGAQTLLDVLRYAPGLDIYQPNRSIANVSIRGFNQEQADKLLVMVDGRTIFQDYFGGVTWFTEPLLLTRIKRIEIVRGPGAALYGANAFLGVINIITKSPHELANAASKTSLRSSVGEQGTTLNEFLTSTSTTSGWDFTVGAAYNRSDGFGERKPVQIRDGYVTPMFTLDAQKKMKRGSFNIALGNSEAEAEGSQDVNYIFNGVRYHTSYALASYSEENVKNPIMARIFVNTSLTDTATAHLSDSLTTDIELQQQYRLSAQHNLVYGTSYRHISLGPSYLTGSQSHQQELYALYAQDAIHVNRKTDIFVGLRLDQNSLYGFNITPRVSLIRRLASDQSLRLSFGTAFHAPSLLDTYFDRQVSIGGGLQARILGNPDLEPERSASYEMGYRHKIRGGYVALNASYTRLTNFFVTVPTAFAPSPPYPAGIPTTLQFVNLNGGHSAGFELESQFQISKRVHGLFNYAFQDVRNDDGSIRTLSPHNKINFGIAARVASRWDAYLGAHYVDATAVNINIPAPVVLPPYIRVDARIGYRLGTVRHPLTISFVATDLFDSKHLEYPQVAAPGQQEIVTPSRRTLYLMFEGKF